MSKKKIHYQPLFDEFEDTPWISRNRELNTQAYDLYSNALGELGKQDQQYYEGQASKAMQSAWGDYNRNYQKAVNQNLARNYGRTGSTASTSGGYVTDSLQRQYNDAAARLASQQAQLQDQFINSALQRDLAKLGQYSGAFNTSGQITQDVDKQNYETRQQNKVRQWQNDVLREKNKTDWLRIASEAGASGFKGFTEGMKTGNIWGAIGGAIGGAASGAYNAYADPTGTYGYQDSWNNIMNSGSSGEGMGGLFGGNNTKQLGSNVGGSTANIAAQNIPSNKGGFKPNFSGFTSLFGN